jgi:hypothetical protein
VTKKNVVVPIMKINEVIVESSLRTSSVHSLPDAEVFDDLDNSSPYHMYRFGVALAGSPDNFGDTDGPTRSNLVTIGYTEADREIIDATKRKQGRTSTKISKKQSQETPDVNTQSPIITRKKNKYGI